MKITFTRAVLATAVTALVAVSVGSGFAKGGFSAGMNNPTSTVGSGTTFVSASVGGATTCTTAPTGSTITNTATVSCSSGTTTLPAQTAGAAVVTTATNRAETISASGSISPTTATYRALSCAPASFAESVGTTNPLLARGGLAFAQAGSWVDSKSVTVDGVTGLATSVLNTVTTGPALSIGIWFKSAPGTSGGVLLAMDSGAAQVVANGTSRAIWMDSAGNINAGAISNGTTRRILTGASVDFRDNAWHFASLTTMQNGRAAELRLYVDGVQRANGSYNNNTLPAINGYWHAGWGDVIGTGNWAAASAVSTISNYYEGSLANAFVTTGTMTAAEQTTFSSTTSQATWNSLVAGFEESWPLGDTGGTTFTGALPGGATPCTGVNVIIDDTANPSCAYPTTASTACPALSTTYTLATLVSAGVRTVVRSTTAQAQTFTTTVARNANYSSSFSVGLHLVVPIRIIESSGGFGFTLNWTTNKILI